MIFMGDLSRTLFLLQVMRLLWNVISGEMVLLVSQLICNSLYMRSCPFLPCFSLVTHRLAAGSGQCRWGCGNSKIFFELWIESHEALHLHGDCPSTPIKIWPTRGLMFSQTFHLIISVVYR
jgi:hypothetical protein